MATTPVFGWPYLGLLDAPNGALLGEQLALAIEATVAGNSLGQWTSSLPGISATTTPPNLGTNVLTGLYKIDASGAVDFTFWLNIASVGGAWNVGSGDWLFQLPVPAFATGVDGFPSSGYVFDSSAAIFRTLVCAVYFANTSYASLIIDSGLRLGSGGPGSAWGVGDVIGGQIRYRKA